MNLIKKITSVSFLVVFVLVSAVMPGILMSDTLIPAFAVHEHNATIITDDIIVNADINTAAAIATSKLADSANFALSNSVETITGVYTFGTSGGAVDKFILAGSGSGFTILNAAATAGSGTVVLPTTGTLATLGETETLAGKTLTTPTISGTGFANAIHAHVAANSGGTITEASISDLQSYVVDSSVVLTQETLTATQPQSSTTIPVTFLDATVNSVEARLIGGATAGQIKIMVAINVDNAVTSLGNNINNQGSITFTNVGSTATLISDGTSWNMISSFDVT